MNSTEPCLSNTYPAVALVLVLAQVPPLVPVLVVEWLAILFLACLVTDVFVREVQARVLVLAVVPAQVQVLVLLLLVVLLIASAFPAKRYSIQVRPKNLKKVYLLKF